MAGLQAQTGLEGVVAAETRISMVDGEHGELVIAGYPVAEFAEKATYEEMVTLLWHDALPDRAELENITIGLAHQRALSATALDVLRSGSLERLPVMDALGMAAGTMRLPHSSGNTAQLVESLPSSPVTGYRVPGNLGVGWNAVPRPYDSSSSLEMLALGIVARLPTIIAAYWRFLQGQEPVEPRSDLGHAANYLYMLTGSVPGADHVRALDTYLCTVCDHGLNASTFAARVIISTHSDLLSAIVGALGALKGPLHGGAPGPALDMVFEIGSAERAEPFLRAKLDRGERLMGFGHRIYKVRDPRADVLAAAASRLYLADGDLDLYELALHVERTALRLLEEYKPGRRLQTNVEFYTALLLHGIGLPTDLFTPTFAIGRAAGWIAHCLEQQCLDRLIRPQSVYIGERGRQWLPVDVRVGADIAPPVN